LFFSREAGGDDREGHGHDHGGSHTREDPQSDEHCWLCRERGGEIGGRECDQSDHQDGLATPPVTDGPDGQEQRGQRERVAVDDPQQLALGGAEVLGEGLLCDVEARDRGDDGDERDTHGSEDEPAPTGVLDHDVVFDRIVLALRQVTYRSGRIRRLGGHEVPSR
jgi:hypothetical protein